MKVCTRCKLTKPLTDFNFKYKTRGIFQYHCKECSRKYVQEHYINNREYYLLKAQKRNNRIRQQVRKYIINYLSVHPCVDCGEKDADVLEFDHVRKKNFLVSRTGRTKSVEAVTEEIKNCEVRCANCHRRITAKRSGWSKRLPL